MKKVLFFAAALFVASFANAQEEQNVNAEASQETASQNASNGNKPGVGTFSLEVAFTPFTNESSPVALENGRLNAAYSFNDKLSARLGLGWGVVTKKTEQSVGGFGVKGEEHSNVISIAPGIVYSFDGTAKMTPYIGGELTFRHSSYYTEVSGHKSDKVKENAVGLQAFTGMNYYFTQNVYVGVEVGVGFNYSKSADDTKTVTFAPYAQPAIRLGWAF